ncbi:hypothetical protein B566_EDAN012630 [Ephemera danica]|nr:hypothetical protein B566_EDAN012630 [Ephemera danica]
MRRLPASLFCFAARHPIARPLHAPTQRNLALGIGLQNFPEGLAVSLPLHASGFSVWSAERDGGARGRLVGSGGCAGRYPHPPLRSLVRCRRYDLRGARRHRARGQRGGQRAAGDVGRHPRLRAHDGNGRGAGLTRVQPQQKQCWDHCVNCYMYRGQMCCVSTLNSFT